MRTRKLNLVFLTILVVGLALFGGALHLVHGFQVRRNASALLARARRAESDKQTEKAEEALSWYLSLRPDDGRTWAWYARMIDRSDLARRQLDKVYMVHQQALRRVPGDRALKRRCVDLAMEVNRHGDARVLLTELLDDLPANATAADRAEIEDLLGQCESGLGRHREAEKWYVRAIEHDPHQVETFDRLARLRLSELRQIDAAAATIQEMIARNPQSGRAYAYRWRYALELAPPADDEDVARGLKLAPEDREVLLSAALDSELKKDVAALRAALEKGHRRDPEDLPFALSLARLETREGHLDRAEAVLRRTYQAHPVAGLSFELADVLILQGKIDGKDGAGEFIDQLRRVGMGDTVVRFLEAEIPYRRKKWNEAIDKLEMARASLGSDPNLSLRINLMLADCHGRLGADEPRLDALRRAAERDRGSETARLELVRVLALSGQVDQAISALSPMAVSGTDPEWRLDLARLLFQKVVRQPRGRRNWAEVEQHLREAEKALPEASGPVVSLHLDILAAQDRWDEARTMLAQLLEEEPRNLGYRLALARLTQRQGRPDEALRIIDQAERDLGPGSRIDLARLDYWAERGGDAAQAELARLAETRGQVPDTIRPAFLQRLGSVAIRLGRPDLARQYERELAELQPENLQVRLRLFDLALAAGDRDEPTRLIDETRTIEGENGVNWRFARAALLIDQARRGVPEVLGEARRLAADIAERKPNWWVGPSLNGEIAELAGSTDEAITFYLHALELGNVRPSFARRLMTLLDQQGRRDEIDHVTRVLRDQGAALAEVTLVRALDALRKQDYDLAISLAREVYPDGSPDAADHLKLGRIYQAAGRLNEAGREFRRAVELGRGVPENWLAYVRYLVQVGQFDQARAVREAARQALPPDGATLTLAQCAAELGERAQAEALIKQAMEAGGKADDPEALRVAAEVSLRLNQLDAARGYLDRIGGSPTASPADRAWANRTRAVLWLGTNRPADHERALALVDRNLARDPENVEDLALKATILALRAPRRGEAIAILERLAGTNRLNDEQRFLLAQLHLGRNEEVKYEGEMLDLLDRKVKDPRHLAHFVNHWVDRNQLDQADRWLSDLKQADPQGRPALELEARLLDIKKQRPELLALLTTRARAVPDEIGVVADLLNRYGFTKEAEAAYKAYIARDPRQPERTLALAQFLARQDRVKEAMEIFRKAWVTCRPEQVAAAALPLYDARSAGDHERRQIEAWLAEAVRANPKAVNLEANLSVLRIRQGQFDQAEGSLRRILSVNPDYVDALNSLAWLISLRNSDKAREAVALINHAIEIQGAVPMLADTLAVARIRMGESDQAVRDLETIRQQVPGKPGFALHLAWAYQANGQTDRARVSFQEAEKLGLQPRSLDPLELAVYQRLRKELFPG